MDSFLSGISMYRLMQWYLRFLWGVAITLSFLKILPYNPLDILISSFYLIGICYITNQLFAHIVKVKPNYESQFITGLILALIIGPLPLVPNLFFLTIAPVLAMASKYFITLNKQHIFNPAAFAIVLTAILFHNGASWWIGSLPMSPFIILGGIVILRKIHRFNLTGGFLLTYLLFLIITNYQELLSLSQAASFLTNIFLISPLVFFSTVMLTEPLTTPSDKTLRISYGIITALIFISLQKFTPVFFSLELSLLIANLGYAALKFNYKNVFILKEKKEIAQTIWQFIFKPIQPLNFTAGQFLEWRLPHKHADNRGTRRFFTISSSPSEKNIYLTVKIPDKPSSFKSALKNLPIGHKIQAGNLEGDFTLGNNLDNTLVFLAGGIGITPFRSIIKYLLDNNQNVPIILFYAASSEKEFAYKDLFTEAEKKLNIKIIYTITKIAPKDWKGETGHINGMMLKRYVKHEKQAIYYISGPEPMVMSYEKILSQMGIKKSHLKTDYFPGYKDI